MKKEWFLRSLLIPIVFLGLMSATEADAGITLSKSQYSPGETVSVSVSLSPGVYIWSPNKWGGALGFNGPNGTQYSIVWIEPASGTGYYSGSFTAPSSPGTYSVSLFCSGHIYVQDSETGQWSTNNTYTCNSGTSQTYTVGCTPNNNCAPNTCTGQTCWNGCSYVSGTMSCGCTPSNNCAPNTCTGQTCWNGCANVAGTKSCGCTPSNNCAPNTCTGQTCWNGCANVAGTKSCGCTPSNNCAPNTCTGQTCWNGCSYVSGTMSCGCTPSNNCAPNTCTGQTCWNGCSYVSGTKSCGCTPSNNCAPNTCTGQTCWNGCSYVSGTKNCAGACGTANGATLSCGDFSNCLGGRSVCSSGSATGYSGTEPGGANPLALHNPTYSATWVGWDWSCSGSARCLACLPGYISNGSTCVPACTPSCANAPNVCSGVWFSDGCGGGCYGSKNCTPAPTLNFWADSTNLAYNGATTLRWNSTNATSCSASGNWSGGKALSGAEGTGNLTSSRTYYLTCSGAGGSISRTVTVNVALPPLGTPGGLQSNCGPGGNQVTLSWNGVSTATAYNLRVDDQTTGWNGTCASPDECRDVYSTSYTRAVVPGRSYGWWVHAYRAADGAGSGAAIGLSFRCDPPPTLTLTADSTNLAYNAATTLRWNSTNTTSCTASGNWSGGKAVNGAEGTGNLTSSRTYTLTCSGPGGSISRSVVVNVALPPLGTPSNLQANCNAAGNQVTLSWSAVSGATMYPLRVDDTSSGWTGTCASVGAGDTCTDVGTNSYTRAVVPGRSYGWWVHAYRAADGAGSPAAIGGSFQCHGPVTVSGRVFNQSTGAGIAGVSIPACAANPGTTTNASGNFSFSVPYDAGYCIRLNPEARAGMDGPITTGNIPSLQYMHTYEYQRAGVNCATAGCGGAWDTYDRSTDTGFNFAYTNMTPRLIICPATVSIAVGGSANLESRYWANLASVPDCNTTGYTAVTPSSTWTSGSTTIATVTNSGTKGVATGVSAGTATISALYSGITATRNVTVTAAPASASCSINPVALGGGQYRLDYTINWGSYNLAAFVGSGGSTLWQQINKSGSPQSGSFTDTPTSTSTYTITPLTGFSPGPPVLCNATVTPPAPPTLGVAVSANPASGNAPLASVITATVSGTATGTINYHFYCDGTTLTRSYLGQSATSMTHTCNYATAGNYSPKVEVERSTAPRASGTANVNVGTPSYMLNVTNSGAGSGSGRVTSSPAGIDCGSDCSESYALNTNVTLTAAASALGRFNSWSGACSGSVATCTVRMDAAKSVTAVFDAVPPCTCRATDDDDYCKGKTYTNSCGNTCNGSKNCDAGPYKEVTP